MGIIITSRIKVQEYILDRCIELTGRNLELMKHEDDSQLAVIDNDTREVLFTSDLHYLEIGNAKIPYGTSFADAYDSWCKDNKYQAF